MKENVALSMSIYLYFSMCMSSMQVYIHTYTHIHGSLRKVSVGKISKWNLGSSKDTEEGLAVLSVTTGRF